MEKGGGGGRKVLFTKLRLGPEVVTLTTFDGQLPGQISPLIIIIVLYTQARGLEGVELYKPLNGYIALSCTCVPTYL